MQNILRCFKVRNFESEISNNAVMFKIKRKISRKEISDKGPFRNE
jgi:hypothetical protein